MMVSTILSAYVDISSHLTVMERVFKNIIAKMKLSKVLLTLMSKQIYLSRFNLGLIIASFGSALSARILVFIHIFCSSVNKKCFPCCDISSLSVEMTTPTNKLVMKKPPSIMNSTKKRAKYGECLYLGTSDGPWEFTVEYMVIGQLTVYDITSIYTKEFLMLSKL